MSVNISLKKLKTDKTFIIVSSALLLLIDLVSMFIFIYKGTPLSYSWINLLILIFDGFYFFQVFVSNPRFRYFLISTIIVLVLDVMFSVIFINKFTDALYAVCTVEASSHFYQVRLCLLIALLVITILCNGFMTKGKKITSFVLSVLETTYAIVYIVFLCINGVFGQGINNIDVIYYQNTAYDLLEHSDKINKAYVCEKFYSEEIKYVNPWIFLCDTVEFEDAGKITAFTTSGSSSYNTNIIVDKKDIDNFKNLLWQSGFKTCANNVVVNADSLKKDEVYVTFAYNTSYTGVRLNTWFGTKGAILDGDYLSTSYAAHSDENNPEDLAWCYTNNSKKIMVVNDEEGYSLVEKYINSNHIALVEFNNIFKLNFTDNDTVYTLDNTNNVIKNSGSAYYATKNTMNKFFTNFVNSSNNRSGMTYTFEVIGGGDIYNLTSGKEYNINVIYAMNTPKVIVTNDKSSYTYGENVNIACNIDFVQDVIYTVTSTGNTIDDYTVTVSKPFVGTGQSEIVVKATKADSSLSSYYTVKQSYTVSKKELAVSWTGDGSITYDGNTHDVTGDLYKEDFVSGDVSSDLTYKMTTSKNVGTYNADFDNSLLTKYSLRSTKYKLTDLYDFKETKTTLKINQKEVTCSWANNQFTYNGSLNGPSVSISGQLGDDSVPYEVKDAKKTDAGTYTATLSIANSNYYVTNYTYNYTIQPRTITVNWDNSTLNYTYDGNVHKPSGTFNSILNADTGLIVISGSAKNAGKHTATMTVNSSNYTISGSNQVQFEIAKKAITINWSVTSATYDGTEKKPTYTVTGLISGDTPNIKLTGCGTNAGNYNVTASSNDTNYVVTTNATTSFVINKCQIAVTWNQTNFVYNGSKQQPTPSVSSTYASKGVTVGLVEDVNSVNVGNYTVYAKLNNNNYEISTGNKCDYTISKADIDMTGIRWEVEVTKDNTYQVVIKNLPQYVTVNTITGNTGTEMNHTYECTVTFNVSNTNYNVPANLVFDWQYTSGGTI